MKYLNTRSIRVERMKKLSLTFLFSVILLARCSDDTEIPVEEVYPFKLTKDITFGLSIRSDFMQSMVTLDDHSIVCVGWADNENTPNQATNILITKFDKDLNLIWNKVIGGTGSDLVREIISTNDGGFLISASVESSDGNFTENKGSSDIAIIKLTMDGNIDWIKTYGGSEYDGVNKTSLVQLDNGYAFVGFTKSEDVGISNKVGLHDIWLNEIDFSGNITNSIAIGSTGNDYPYSIVKTNTGYAVLSKIGASTADFDKPGVWVFEMDLNGEIGWKTSLDVLNAGKLIQTTDGGYAVLSTNQNNITDLFLTKINNQGNVQWEKSYPLPDQEFAEDIIQIDNGYVILGSSESGTSIPRNGNAYVAQLNESGEVMQSIIFGDTKISASRIFRTGDGEYIMGGTKNIGQSYIDSEFFLEILSNSK